MGVGKRAVPVQQNAADIPTNGALYLEEGDEGCISPISKVLWL